MGAMTDTIGDRVLCDADCVTKLAAGDIVTTASGLQYQDIIEGRGPVPEVGYQVRELGFYARICTKIVEFIAVVRPWQVIGS